jgi:hypothetical protein
MSTAYFDRRSRLLVIDCLNLEGYPLRYSCAPYLRRGDGSHIESLELQPGNDPHQEVHLLCQRTKAQGVLLLNMLQRFGLQRSRTILHDLRTVMGREMPVFLGGTVEVLCSQLMAEPQQGGVPVLDRLEGLAGTEGMSSIPRLCLAGNDETDGLDMKEFALVLESLACNSEIDVLLPGAAASGASQWGSGWSLTVQPDDSMSDL